MKKAHFSFFLALNQVIRLLLFTIEIACSNIESDLVSTYTLINSDISLSCQCSQESFPITVKELEDWTMLFVNEPSVEENSNILFPKDDICYDIFQNTTLSKEMEQSILNQISLDSVRVRIYSELIHKYGESIDDNCDFSSLLGYTLTYEMDFDAISIKLYSTKNRQDVLISPSAYRKSMMFVAWRCACNVEKYIQSMFDVLSIFYVPFISDETFPTLEEELVLVKKITALFKAMDFLYIAEPNDEVWNSLHQNLVEFIEIRGSEIEQQSKRLKCRCENNYFDKTQRTNIITSLDGLRYLLHGIIIIPFFFTLGVRLFQTNDSYTWLSFLIGMAYDSKQNSINNILLASILNITLGEIFLLHYSDLINANSQDDFDQMDILKELTGKMNEKIEVQWIINRVMLGMKQTSKLKFS